MSKKEAAAETHKKQLIFFTLFNYTKTEINQTFHKLNLS